LPDFLSAGSRMAHDRLAGYRRSAGETMGSHENLGFAKE
jgi:hypothetical protein